MILKKIGQIKGVTHKTAFCALPEKKLIVVERMQPKGSELSFYKTFEVAQKIQLDSIGELSKAYPQNDLAFAIDNKKICFINSDTYKIREVPLNGQITATHSIKKGA
ncbi:MAG: hypothetical protein RL329_1811 [Bacteroidota bacterium]|jgi:hypothetical protein